MEMSSEAYLNLRSVIDILATAAIPLAKRQVLENVATKSTQASMGLKKS